MAQQINHIVEGYSINRPPYFNGEDDPYWKDRMRLFIESTNLVPQVVADPNQLPPVVVRTIPRNEWVD